VARARGPAPSVTTRRVASASRPASSWTPPRAAGHDRRRGDEA
jgi:hypothetical protein